MCVKRVCGFMVGLLGLCLASGCSVSANDADASERRELPDSYYTYENEELSVYSKASRLFHDSTGYVNDIVLAAFENDASEDTVWEVAEFLGGTPVGKLSGMSLYQIQVPKKSEAKLEELCQAAMDADIDGLCGMMLDPIVRTEEALKDDAQAVSDMNETDWRSEIHADEALALMGNTKGASIGIVDSAFAFGRKDIDWFASEAVKDYNATQYGASEEKWHGTAVAALAGAVHNESMNGVAPAGTRIYCADKNLYEYEHSGIKSDASVSSISSLMEAVLFCLKEDCMVVNFSQGVTDSKDVIKSREYASSYLYLIDKLMSKKFMIVQAAGNDGSTLEHSIGCFTQLTPSNVKNGILNKLYLNGEDMDREFITDVSGESWWNGYWKKFQSQILVVGNSVNSKYVYNGDKSPSNYGPYVDIYAPGVNLKVPEGRGSKYRTDAIGSSYSAPQVTGVVSMIWGKYPILSSAQVKDCIIGGTFTKLIRTIDVTKPGLETSDKKSDWQLNAEQALKYAAILNKDGSYGKMPTLLTAKGGTPSKQQNRRLQFGMSVSDKHLNLEDAWQFRFSHDRNIDYDSDALQQYQHHYGMMFGGFYHIQEDEKGYKWLRCRELSAYILDNVLTDTNRNYHYCAHYKDDLMEDDAYHIYEDVDFIKTIPMYRIWEPGEEIIGVPDDVKAEITENRTVFDWVIYGISATGEKVLYYGH